MYIKKLIDYDICEYDICECNHYRMAGLDKPESKHSLFKDEKELTVAVKYMIENGTKLHKYIL